jgi:hypothetical protein
MMGGDCADPSIRQHVVVRHVEKNETELFIPGILFFPLKCECCHQKKANLNIDGPFWRCMVLP